MIAFEPKSGAGTFWCHNMEELSDLLEMLGDEQNAKDEEIYQAGYTDGFNDGQNATLNELASQEASEAPPVASPLILPTWMKDGKNSLVA